MKCFEKLMVCLAGGLALTAGLRADEIVLPGNPYAPVVARNIFGLNPVSAVTTTIFDAPLPKITANGIMSIFGQRQVLFKVDIEAWSGKPAKAQSYILAEGQRQDDVEVTHIEEKTGTVTFNNHGTVQDIILVNGSPSTTAASSGATGINPMPGAAGGPGGNNGAPGINNRFGGRFGGRNGGGNPGGTDNGPGFRSVPTRSNPAPPPQTLSPEAQIMMIEAQRAQYQSEGDPTAKILPPTEQMQGNDGNPP